MRKCRDAKADGVCGLRFRCAVVARSSRTTIVNGRRVTQTTTTTRHGTPPPGLPSALAIASLAIGN
eukprot:993799-Prorocentrum_minimum.AAC.2